MCSSLTFCCSHCEEKGLVLLLTCGPVKLSEGGKRRRKRVRERKRRRRRSCRGRLSRTGSKDNKLVGLIYGLVELEWLDCKCCRKNIC